MYKTGIAILITFTFLAVFILFGYLAYQQRNSIDPRATSTPEEFLPVSTERPKPNASSTNQKPEVPQSVEWKMTDEVEKMLRTRWSRGTEEVIGYDTRSYNVEYSVVFDWFSIFIFAEPSAQYRKEAEAELLAATGMTETQACNFKVYVKRVTDLTGPKNFQNIGLSFCPGSVSDADLLKPYYEELP